MSDDVVELAACHAAGAAAVGGKAIGLGRLIEHGFPVPPGFAVTAEAYRRSIARAGLPDRIAALLPAAGADLAGIRDASRQIMGLFTPAVLEDALAEAIAAAYRTIGPGAPPVAVRSSATAEDTAEASFAGQQETYLWICGEPAVREHVVRCWASLFTPQAIKYRARFGVGVEDLAMGVVVQQMIPAESAGVMMTLEPVGGDRTKVYIEAAYGLGEGVVRGDVGVDRFLVAKDGLACERSDIAHKAQAHRVDLESGRVGLTAVASGDRDRPCLTDPEVQAIADLGVRIEEAFGAPMDVEWAIVGAPGAREVKLLQARPETVWSRR